MNHSKINEVLQLMKAHNFSQLLISDPISIDYLIGYRTDPGERLLLLILHQKGPMQLILNRLFPDVDPVGSFDILHYSDGQPILEQISHQLGDHLIGIDKNWPSHFLLELMNCRPDLRYDNGSRLIDQVRSIKSQEEIALMRLASQKNDQVMAEMIERLQDGLTERQMREQLAHLYQQYDCDGFCFEPIIAYGPHGADPHHETNDSLPQVGQSIVIDIGSRYQGYCSDMTRTVFYGSVSPQFEHVYYTVLEASQAAIDQVKPGVSFASIDLAARRVIEEAGYGDYFTHRTGHSIGRECHEYGDVGQHNSELVQVGNVFSIEPGIYLPNQMGVRIEDLVVVTEGGCEVLNQASKDLIIIPVHHEE